MTTDALEFAISQKARAFDPATLLALLRDRFPDRAIHLRSDPSLALRGSAVEAVHFNGPSIEVRLNFGLLSSSSPLPSHFIELSLSPSRGGPLSALLEMLDERLLRDRVEALRPSLAPRLSFDGRQTRKDLLDLAQVASPASLHRVAAWVFPELSVSVRRADASELLRVDDPRLGNAMLGTSALGGRAVAARDVLEVILRTRESLTDGGAPWAVEARARVAGRLLPALAGTGARLVVLLVDFEGEGVLRLARQAVMGIDPIGRARAPRVTVLFEGAAPEIEPEPTPGDPNVAAHLYVSRDP